MTAPGVFQALRPLFISVKDFPVKNKLLLALCLTFASASWAAGNSVSGEVLETQDAGGYTYVRLKTAQGETWAAVNQAKLSKGAKISIDNAMTMTNFESKTLKKTFPTILFGTLGGAGAGASAAAMPMGTSKPAADLGPIKVAKASGANARTVAEIVAKPADLKDKSVRVAGKVVKYNPGIMGKNWIHLQDGSGDAAKKTNDLLVTTKADAKVGDVVTITGTVRLDKDFGSGYSYKVLVEDATLQR